MLEKLITPERPTLHDGQPHSQFTTPCAAQGVGAISITAIARDVVNLKEMATLTRR